MGASGSKSAVAPILPATQLSAAQVAEAVKALGEPYVPYSTKVEEDGMDGAFLQTLADEDLVSVLQEIGVTSIVHKKKLEALFKSFKDGASASNDDGRPGGGIQTPYTRPSAIIKAFAGFLSHYKLECGTEARFVQVQLKPILDKDPIEGSNHDVFLDSDDLSDLLVRNLLQHVMQTKVLVLLQTK